MIRANKFSSFLILCIFWGGTVLAAEAPVALSSMDWQSLGFSADGKFYATITYGVEYELKDSESRFFARLQVQHLKGGASEVVLERLLRRSLPMDSGVSARSIMVDLLRKEARELYNFQIDALVQGEILFSEKEASEANKEEDSPIEEEGNPDEVGTAMAELVAALNEAENLQLDNPTYIARRNADTTVFYLRKMEMDGVRSLRGQLVVVQSGALPRRYAFQRSWNSLLENSAKDLALEPVFVSLSPDARHLVMVLKASDQMDLGYTGSLEQNNRQEFVTLALTVY